MILKFQLSDPIWWGYNLDIKIEQFTNLRDIIKYVIENLNATLISLNLIPQAEQLEKVTNKFHIHDVIYENLSKLNYNDVVYICRHNVCNNDNIKLS